LLFLLFVVICCCCCCCCLLFLELKVVHWRLSTLLWLLLFSLSLLWKNIVKKIVTKFYQHIQ
jgi:hypothetical protein